MNAKAWKLRGLVSPTKATRLIVPVPEAMMDASKLRDLAAQAAAHIGERDQHRTRRPQRPRSCAGCTFWSNSIWQGEGLQKAPHGCSDAILDGRTLTQRVQVPEEEAERSVCGGWVDRDLAGFLHDGYAFDAIALETRKPDLAEVSGGRDRLAALVRAQSGVSNAPPISAPPQLIGPSMIDLQRQRALAQPVVTPRSPRELDAQSDPSATPPMSAREFVTATVQVFAFYVVVGLVINVLSDGGAVSFEELFSPIGLFVVAILSVITTALLARAQ